MYQAKMKTARFEVLTAVLLKIQVFWWRCAVGRVILDVSNDGGVDIFRIKQSKTLKLKTLQTFKTTGNTHPTLQHNMPERLKLRDKNF